MPLISFLCPSCEKTLKVNSKYTGVKSSCPSCNDLIQAPEKKELLNEEVVVLSDPACTENTKDFFFFLWRFDEAGRARLRLPFISAILGVFCLLAGIGYLSYKKYEDITNKEHYTNACKLAEENKFNEAQVLLKTFLSYDPKHTEANRLVAHIAFLSKTEEEIDWRKKVLRSRDPKPADWLHLAFCYIQHKNFPLAEKSLERYEHHFSSLPAEKPLKYHQVASALSIQKKEISNARKHLEILVKRQPENIGYQFHLGSLEILSQKTEKKAQGKQRLFSLLKHKDSDKSAILKTLLQDSIRHKDLVKAMEYYEKILTYTPLSIAERTRVMTLLYEQKDARWKTLLKDSQSTSLKEKKDIHLVIAWMNQNNLTSLADYWISTLDPILIRKYPLALHVSETLYRAHGWEKLQPFLNTCHWGKEDYLRLTLIDESFGSGNIKKTFASMEWQGAVYLQGLSIKKLKSFISLCKRWGLKEKELTAWWAMTRYPKEREKAFAYLGQHYQKKKNTFALLKVCRESLEKNPENTKIENHYAYLCLLLERNMTVAKRIAKKNYQKNPQNPDFATTYAFSLYKSQRITKAMEVIKKVPEKQLQKGRIANLYGFLWSLYGDDTQARKYFQLGADAPFFHEEEKLFNPIRERFVTQL